MALELIVSGADFEEIAVNFAAEERELLVLIAQADFGGLPKAGGSLYTDAEFAAVLDLASGVLSAHAGFLKFLLPDPHRFGNFVKHSIYHVKARTYTAASEDEKMQNRYRNQYLLTAVIADGMTDPRMEQLKQQLQAQDQQQANQLASLTPPPFYSEAFRSEIRFNVENESVSPEFVKRCEAHLKQMPDSMVQVIMEAAKKYCLFFMDLCKESAGDQYDPSEFPPVTPDTPASAAKTLTKSFWLAAQAESPPCQTPFAKSSARNLPRALTPMNAFRLARRFRAECSAANSARTIKSFCST